MRRKHEVSLEDVYCEARGVGVAGLYEAHSWAVWPDLQRVPSDVDAQMLECMREGKTEAEMSEAAGVGTRYTLSQGCRARRCCSQPTILAAIGYAALLRCLWVCAELRGEDLR